MVPECKGPQMLLEPTLATSSTSCLLKVLSRSQRTQRAGKWGGKAGGVLKSDETGGARTQGPQDTRPSITCKNY